MTEQNMKELFSSFPDAIFFIIAIGIIAGMLVTVWLFLFTSIMENLNNRKQRKLRPQTRRFEFVPGQSEIILGQCECCGEYISKPENLCDECKKIIKIV